MTHFGRITRHLIAIAGALLVGVPAALAQGVDIEVDQFGFGLFRPGGLVPIRLKLTSNLDKAQGVWVQWQVPNADGDIGEYGRSLTLSPGQPALTWLYAPLMPNDTQSTVWTVRVFEEADGERRGELGGRRISPADVQAQMVDLAEGMISVIGDRRLGLDDYTMAGGSSKIRPVGGHENTRVASNLKPSQLPDRWFGLMGFEALLWAGDNVSPQDMSIDQAEAVRQYVQWGGQLIIVLPTAGNPWGLGAAGQTLIEDLLPCRTSGVVPRRDEATPLAALLPVMSKTRSLATLNIRRDPPEFSIRVFKDLPREGDTAGAFNVIDNGYEPLITLPDGRVVAVQKRVGFGRVTVIGIDLADGRLGSLGLPQADVFWNRVLGRRMDTPTPGELQAMEKRDRLERWNFTNDRSMGSGSLFSTGISMTGTAGAGLLLALLMFVAYWLVATFAFFILRRYDLARHAWLAYAATAAVFTVVAWGSVGLVPRATEVQHVTVLDHIALPPDSGAQEQYQRATSFFSVYLPNYGFTRLSLERGGDHRNVLLPWSPPGEQPAPFPNTNTFRVDVARNMADFRLPSRATTTQLYADWMGGLDAKWGGLLRVDPANPLRVVQGADGSEATLAGSIVSDLPGPLKDVLIIWIRNQRLPNRSYAQSNNGRDEPWVNLNQSGAMMNVGYSWRVLGNAGLDSGASFDVSALRPDGSSSMIARLGSLYVDPYSQRSSQMMSDSTTLTTTDQHRFMEMMSIFQHLPPPTYIANNNGPNSNGDTVTFHRELGRELDLSTWFTRPCVIVIGYLENSELPIPLRIGSSDEPPTSTGLTMVRWIYPLPLDERISFPLARPVDDDTSSSSTEG